MSNLPTLLRKGFVVPPEGMSKHDKEKLENTISIDYLLNFISNRIPKDRNGKIPITPTRYGDKVIILKSKTGSGKSTVLPPALYNTFMERTKKNIIVTQPRILTAIDIPNTIVKYDKNLQIEKNIGYSTKDFKRLPTEKGMIFCTVGVLTQQLIAYTDEEFMQKYQFVILDEVHERDLETDLVLYLLKKLIQNNYDNPNCPLIILMSATFNEKIFMQYFDTPKENYIQVIGSTFPIEDNFPEYSIANYVKYATLKAQEIHLDNLEDADNNEKFRDIIIFVQAAGVGKKIYDELLTFNSIILDGDLKDVLKYRDSLKNDIKALFKGGNNVDKNYYVLPILLDKKNFEAGGIEYQNVFSDISTVHVPLWKVKKGEIDLEDSPYKYVRPTRRIIIATNIAETGLTIPTLKYCIDTGFQISVDYFPDYNCNSLMTKNITQGMAIQRRGRVGRQAPGIWYPCYTKETYEQFLEDQLSKILISDFTQNLLSILIKEKNTDIVEEKSVQKIKERKNLFLMHKYVNNKLFKVENELKTNISSLDFIELPSFQSLTSAVEKLHILGFIDDNYDVTPTGFYSNKISFISTEAKKMILSGYSYGAYIYDLITITAFIEVGKRYIFGKSFKLENFIKKNEFEFYINVLVADDFICSIFVWNLFQEYLNKLIIGEKSIYLDNIKKWCEDNELKYDGLLSVMQKRDSILENLITIGMNPYYNSLGLKNTEYNLNNIIKKSLEDGIEEIKKIKMCLYEGFKCNILGFKRNKYISLYKNIPVKVKSQLIKEINPESNDIHPAIANYILVDSYLISQKRSSAQFEFIAEGYVSVLDGYVTVDDRFYFN